MADPPAVGRIDRDAGLIFALTGYTSSRVPAPLPCQREHAYPVSRENPLSGLRDRGAFASLGESDILAGLAGALAGYPKSSGARARDGLISHLLASGYDNSEIEIVASAMLAVQRCCLTYLHPTMTHVSEHGGLRRTAVNFQLRCLRGDRRRAREAPLREAGDAVAEDEHVEGCHGATLSHERRRNRRGWRPRAAPWNAKLPG